MVKLRSDMVEKSGLSKTTKYNGKTYYLNTGCTTDKEMTKENRRLIKKKFDTVIVTQRFTGTGKYAGIIIHGIYTRKN